MSTACAPGKIILLGEHAVVYGRPALAVPVRQVRACATVEPAAEGPSGGIELVAPELGLDAWLHDLPRDHPLVSICRATLAEIGVATFPPIRLTIASSIPVASGLGSSAAVSVATARALGEHFDRALSIQKVSDLAFDIERIHHGTPSGIDNTVVAFDRAVFFHRGESPQTLSVGGRFSFLIGDTGVAAPTAEAVAHVRERWTANRIALEAVFDQIASLVLDGREALEKGLPERLGGDLRRNHQLLQGLGVSSAELDGLVRAADGAGALGAKMSGGGMGGNMIALVTADRREAVADALRRAGAGVLQTEVAP